MRFSAKHINEILDRSYRALMLAEQQVGGNPFGGASGADLFNNQNFLFLLWMAIWQTEQLGPDVSGDAVFGNYAGNSTNNGRDIGPMNINIAFFIDAMYPNGADPNDPAIIAEWRQMATTPQGSMQILMGYFRRYVIRKLPENATPEQVIDACYAVWLRGPRGRRSPTWGTTADQGMENFMGNFHDLLQLFLQGEISIQDYEGLQTIINNLTGRKPKPASQGTPTVSRSPNQTHTVRPGDSLSKIAANYSLTLQQLLAANPTIVNPDVIQPGQTITIPHLMESVFYEAAPPPRLADPTNPGPLYPSWSEDEWLYGKDGEFNPAEFFPGLSAEETQFIIQWLQNLLNGSVTHPQGMSSQAEQAVVAIFQLFVAMWIGNSGDRDRAMDLFFAASRFAGLNPLDIAIGLGQLIGGVFQSENEARMDRFLSALEDVDSWNDMFSLLEYGLENYPGGISLEQIITAIYVRVHTDDYFAEWITNHIRDVLIALHYGGITESSTPEEVLDIFLQLIGYSAPTPQSPAPQVSPNP